MPTLDALDYERFNYEDSNARPLSLDEAVKRAADLRKSDRTNFYRVEPTDSSATGFRIEKISSVLVYAEFISRFSQRFARRVMSHKA